MTDLNPYDEVPYKCLPVEWTAPERLALTALLHGGPRSALVEYRVLELGCGDGANLLPLAYYRPNGRFFGVDGASSQIRIAESHKKTLGLRNVEFVRSPFSDAGRYVSGQFDFIVAHGIFSWVDDTTRDALFDLCAARLAPAGLLYLNYNAKPGWNVRGMVRDFLLAQTASAEALTVRAQEAQQASRTLMASLSLSDHPYSQLLANEFRLVADSHPSYVAHEFLAADNRAYWRSEFMQMAQRHGLAFVADADFNYHSGRMLESSRQHLTDARITGCCVEDTLDLLHYRQLHSPILTRSPFTPVASNLEECAELILASCLEPTTSEQTQPWMFVHPTGHRVEAKEEVFALALTQLRDVWPRGIRLGDLFADIARAMDDVRLLHRSGLVELRLVEPALADREPLRSLEARYGGYVTSPYHTREPIAAASTVVGRLPEHI